MGKAGTIGKRSEGRRKSGSGPGSLAVDGNRLTLLPDGPPRLEALLGLIDGATHSIRLLYYTYLGDRTGERVKQALLRARERGVAVSLLLDGFGSSATPDDYFADLSRSGAKFCRFNPS